MTDQTHDHSDYDLTLDELSEHYPAWFVEDVRILSLFISRISDKPAPTAKASAWVSSGISFPKTLCWIAAGVEDPRETDDLDSVDPFSAWGAWRPYGGDQPQRVFKHQADAEIWVAQFRADEPIEWSIRRVTVE